MQTEWKFIFPLLTPPSLAFLKNSALQMILPFYLLDRARRTRQVALFYFFFLSLFTLFSHFRFRFFHFPIFFSYFLSIILELSFLFFSLSFFGNPTRAQPMKHWTKEQSWELNFEILFKKRWCGENRVQNNQNVLPSKKVKKLQEKENERKKVKEWRIEGKNAVQNSVKKK